MLLSASFPPGIIDQTQLDLLVPAGESTETNQEGLVIRWRTEPYMTEHIHLQKKGGASAQEDLEEKRLDESILKSSEILFLTGYERCSKQRKEKKTKKWRFDGDVWRCSFEFTDEPTVWTSITKEKWIIAICLRMDFYNSRSVRDRIRTEKINRFDLSLQTSSCEDMCWYFYFSPAFSVYTCD